MSRSKEKTEYLFVYGTLRKDIEGGMSRLLDGLAEFVCRGTILGRLYYQGEFPGALQSDKPGERVRGEVYRLDEVYSSLEVIDEYEGCHPAGDGVPLFRRERTTVYMDNGGKLRAWIYFYNFPVEGLEAIPSGDYLEYFGSSK